MRTDDEVMSTRRLRWQRRTTWLLERREAVLVWAVASASVSLTLMSVLVVVQLLGQGVSSVWSLLQWLLGLLW